MILIPAALRIPFATWRLLPASIAAALLAFSPAVSGLHAEGDPNLTLSARVSGSSLIIRTSDQFAGTIYSLEWNGKEFLNAFDHGREMQSAISYDGLGECLNPTEAGSARDGTGSSSSSRLLRGEVHDRKLATTIQMAYWLAPGQSYKRPCGPHTEAREAQNANTLSPDTVRTEVEIGVDHMTNVIQLTITFQIADDHQAATLEALTGYMSPEFSEFFAYDSSNRSVIPLSDGPGEQSYPVIFSTPDHNFAMGIFSPGLPQPTYLRAGYGRWRFKNTVSRLAPAFDAVKWNAVYRESPAPHGQYRYRCYVAIGTLDDVRAAILTLADHKSQRRHAD